MGKANLSAGQALGEHSLEPGQDGLSLILSDSGCLPERSSKQTINRAARAAKRTRGSPKGNVIDFAKAAPPHSWPLPSNSSWPPWPKPKKKKYRHKPAFVARGKRCRRAAPDSPPPLLALFVFLLCLAGGEAKSCRTVGPWPPPSPAGASLRPGADTIFRPQARPACLSIMAGILMLLALCVHPPTSSSSPLSPQFLLSSSFPPF